MVKVQKMPRIPTEVSQEAIADIRQRHGDHLGGVRGKTAQERLLSQFVIGQYQAQFVPEGRWSSELDMCMQWAAEIIAETAPRDSESDARLMRAAGRLLIQAVTTTSAIEQAAARQNISKKQIKRYRDQARTLTENAIQSTGDSFNLFASTEKEDRDDAKRILGIARGGFSSLSAELVKSERGVVKKVKKRKK